LAAVISHYKKLEIYKRDGYICQYCGRPVVAYDFVKGMPVPNDAATIDHIIPKARGGNNCRGNLITSCKECNVFLSDKGEGYPLLPKMVFRRKKQMIRMLNNQATTL